jgi:hypothetical protein
MCTLKGSGPCDMKASSGKISCVEISTRRRRFITHYTNTRSKREGHKHRVKDRREARTEGRQRGAQDSQSETQAEATDSNSRSREEREEHNESDLATGQKAEDESRSEATTPRPRRVPKRMEGVREWEALRSAMRATSCSGHLYKTWWAVWSVESS